MDFFKSKQTLHRYPTDFLIGDLLVKAGVISQNKLDEAIKLSGAKHLQLGQMLIMSGAINAAQLQAAVDTQSLVRDRTIDLNEALKVLKQACKSGQSIADVLASAQTKQSGSTNKLGEVLLEAGLINSDQFSKAMQRSLATGLPLGRILVLNNTLADSVLNMALDLQVRIRDEMITRLEAIDALRSSAGIDGDDMPDPNRVAQAQAALKAPRKHGVRIGEMFVRAGLLTETDVMNALETGLATDQLIGQVLVGQGFITEQILEAALGLQKMVDSNHLEVEKAVDTLSMIQSQGITYDEAVESLHIAETTTAETISFDHMLVLARVLTESEIADAFHAAMEQAKIVGQIFMMTGHIDKHTLKAALRAHFLLQKGAISQDDAVVGLDYCMHSSSKLSFDGALQELGWDISTLPHDDVDPEIRAMEEARKDFGVTSEDELNKFAGEHSSATETTDAVPVIDEELTAAQEEAELRSRIESREPLDGDEIQIRSGSYDEQAEPAEPAEAVSEVAEEEGWEPPVEAAQEEQKEGAEQKRSLSGLLSHEDLEPVEEQEETPTAKKPGKFANLLSDEEKKPAVAEKTETPPASTKGGKFANLLNADEPPAKKVADDTKDEEDKEAAAKAAAEKEAAEKEAAAKKAAEIVAREKAEVEMLAEQIRAAEKAAQEKKAVEKAAADKAAAEKAEKEAAEKAAAEKAAAEKAAAEKAAAEKAAAEKAAAEKAAAAAATPAAATAATTAPAAAADAANKKVGAFQSLLGSETAKAAPAAAPAQSAPPAAAPAQPAPAATPGATPAATPNVAAALTALTRAHPPGAAAAPGTVPPAQAAPAAAARPAAPAPAAAAAPGAPKISPSQIPGAPRPAVPAAQTAPNAVAASPGGPNGSGQAPGAPPRVAVPPGAAAQTVAPAAAVGAPTAPVPTGQPAAAAPAAARSEEDIKGALSGAHARLAESYYDQGNYSEALSLYEKILAVREQELGESDNELVADLANVVRVLCVQNRLDNAESYVRRMIGILEMSQPEDVQKLAETLNTLSQIYFQQKKFEQCQPVLDRAVRLKQQVLGEDHVDMADYYRDYARLLRNLNRPEEAEQFYSRAKLILGKTPKQAVV